MFAFAFAMFLLVQLGADATGSKAFDWCNSKARQKGTVMWTGLFCFVFEFFLHLFLILFLRLRLSCFCLFKQGPTDKTVTKRRLL